MKAKVSNFIVNVEPMRRSEYEIKILNIPESGNDVQGYYCNWNGYRFWIAEKIFNERYIIEDDLSRNK